MAGLIKRNQIDGLVAMKAYLDSINPGQGGSYAAANVTTTVIKTPESAEGVGDQVYYTGDELLQALKSSIDGMLDGGDGLSLPELSRLIDNVNKDLNGGTAKDANNNDIVYPGFKNKSINDVVRIEFNLASGTTATEKIASGDSSKITAEITSGQTLRAYTIDGAPIVGAAGAAISFDLDTKTFSAAPYILDVDATKASGGIDSTTGAINPASAVYTAFTGDFKVFPVGTWTLETLPATALLDNNEMQLIAYDQALQKVIIQLATDKNLIDRITEAVGQTAIVDAVKDATKVIDTRIKNLEGTGADAGTAAVTRSQLTAGTSETVNGNTAVYTAAKAQELLDDITDDIGQSSDATSYDANGKVAGSTVRGEINSIKGKMMYKDALVTSVKSSVTAVTGTNPETGEDIVEQVTDDNNTINETALVTKFAAVDQQASATSTALNTFVNTTAPATYVAQTQVNDGYTKLTKTDGAYTYTYTDADHKDVVGKKLFTEKISEIEDNLSQGTSDAYLHSAIVLATDVSADSSTGVTAKTADTTHVTGGVADADMPVYSKKAVDNLVEGEVEKLDKKIADLDDKTYDFSKIEGYDGTAKTASITATTFNATTGASSTATTTETMVAAGTAETVSENTVVLSKQEAQAELAAAKAELEAVHTADKTETLNRIAYGNTIAQRHLDIEVARLTAESGDTLAAADNGEEAVTATADGAITVLDKKTADWANIEVSAGYSAITDGNNNTIAAAVNAEAAASASTKFTSKQYVDDKVTSSVATLQATVADNNRAMDARVDAIEAVISEVERITPVATGDPAVETVTLSHTPKATSNLEVLVNGVAYYLADGVFTISGTVITWNAVGAGFALGDVLGAGDVVVVKYQWTDSSKLTAIS